MFAVGVALRVVSAQLLRDIGHSFSFCSVLVFVSLVEINSFFWGKVTIWTEWNIGHPDMGGIFFTLF
jgi:hypothetical protein